MPNLRARMTYVRKPRPADVSLSKTVPAVPCSRRWFKRFSVSAPASGGDNEERPQCLLHRGEAVAGVLLKRHAHLLRPLRDVVAVDGAGKRGLAEVLQDRFDRYIRERLARPDQRRRDDQAAQLVHREQRSVQQSFTR